MVVLVDKLVKTQIVECSAVANWIFSSELGSELTNFYVWEILMSTIEKMNRQVEKYQTELADLRRQLNLSTAIQAAASSSSTTTITPAVPALEESSETIAEEQPVVEESKMEATDGAIVAEEKAPSNNLKRRRESDDDENDDEAESREKVQSMHISQAAAPPMDEATAKLHEKYEVVEERLTHARDQQK